MITKIIAFVVILMAMYYWVPDEAPILKNK